MEDETRQGLASMGLSGEKQQEILSRCFKMVDYLNDTATEIIMEFINNASCPVARQVQQIGGTQLQPSPGLRIRTFESEIDPFEFSLPGSGHFVMFRKVWRDGQRYIQGAIIEQKDRKIGDCRSLI